MAAKTVNIKVLRNFLYDGETVKAGQVLENVPYHFAAEMVANNKAQFVSAANSETPVDPVDPVDPAGQNKSKKK
jgi:hypothetical protein